MSEPRHVALGYDRQSGNRFTRTQGTRALVIDVLAPSYLGRLIPNQTHGDLVLDEIPGLLDALLLPPVNVAARAVLTDTTQLYLQVPLPELRAALVMKAHAYAGRLSDNDALDIWRLLQSASNAGHTAADWPTRSTARELGIVPGRVLACTQFRAGGLGALLELAARAPSPRPQPLGRRPTRARDRAEPSPLSVPQLQTSRRTGQRWTSRLQTRGEVGV